MPKKCDHCGKEIIRGKRSKKQWSATRFCSRRCCGFYWRGKWKPAPLKNGGIAGHSHGYRRVLTNNHSRMQVSNRSGQRRGYVYEHILEAEKKYGRPVLRSEHVHHIDGNKSNNSHSNLVILSHLEHMRTERGWQKLGDSWSKPCKRCGLFKEIDVEFSRYANGVIRHFCDSCTDVPTQGR